MKGPTKKLKNMAARYNKVKQQFEFEARAYNFATALEGE